MRLNSAEIRQQAFGTRLRGYDPLGVDAFLQQVADGVEELERKNAELAEQCSALLERVEEFRQREDALRRAFEAAAALREEVEARSRELVDIAEAEAEALRAGAAREAEGLRREAESAARAAREELQILQRRREEWVRNLRSSLEAQLSLLDSGPEAAAQRASAVGERRAEPEPLEPARSARKEGDDRA
ncbi:MAG: DivIVA domain-containing protein [Nitrospinota bacterium]